MEKRTKIQLFSHSRKHFFPPSPNHPRQNTHQKACHSSPTPAAKAQGCGKTACFNGPIRYSAAHRKDKHRKDNMKNEQGQRSEREKREMKNHKSQPTPKPISRFVSAFCHLTTDFFGRKIWPCGFLFVLLHPFSTSGRRPWRDAGVVDRGGLENR